MNAINDDGFLIDFRGVNRLYDKGTHGESLKDFEAATCWLSIPATLASIAAPIVNVQLAGLVAQKGIKVFSTAAQVAGGILNFSSLGLNGIVLATGIINLVNKGRKGDLHAIDFMQLSMGIFFFVNAIFNYTTLSDILARVQQQNQSQLTKVGDNPVLTDNRWMTLNNGDVAKSNNLLSTRVMLQANSTGSMRYTNQSMQRNIRNVD